MSSKEQDVYNDFKKDMLDAEVEAFDKGFGLGYAQGRRNAIEEAVSELLKKLRVGNY